MEIVYIISQLHIDVNWFDLIASENEAYDEANKRSAAEAVALNLQLPTNRIQRCYHWSRSNILVGIVNLARHAKYISVYIYIYFQIYIYIYQFLYI